MGRIGQSLTEYWPAIVVWSRIELPDTSAHDSGSIDSVESDWVRAIDFYLEKVNNHEPIARATSHGCGWGVGTKP